ncbi:MAG TPA: HlyD family secretion protein [Pseudolabrys sp.]|nr:HlyD family secretion protein [Pseudolabrys sp.]
MADLKTKSGTAGLNGGGGNVTALPGRGAPRPRSRVRAVPILFTFATVAIAAALSSIMWNTYMGAPWTRDGAVRVYVVTMAPEVAGKIVQLPVADNQFVHKGDLLMLVDPTNYAFSVQQAEAVVAQTKAVALNAQAEAKRREELGVWSSAEEKETFNSTAASALAAYRQAQANLDQARVNLDRTRILSPVNGYVTNLQAQLGDYLNVGQTSISVVNSDSFWVDGYFEESALWSIQDGDPARIKLLGSRQIIQGHVQGIARGINVPNSLPNHVGLATVNPIFTWVRLAQRVPVRIAIDHLPPGTRLVAGMTATVQIDPKR